MRILDTDNKEETLQYLHDLISYTIKLEHKINKANYYIENELFRGKDDLEWCRKNDGTISGSDLPAYCILNLYDILKGDDENGESKIDAKR